MRRSSMTNQLSILYDASTVLRVYTSLLKNKLGQWQISWIGNCEIEVVIENKCDLAAESFNWGNFVSPCNIVRINSALSPFDYHAVDKLRRPHSVKLISSHSAAAP